MEQSKCDHCDSRPLTACQMQCVAVVAARVTVMPLWPWNLGITFRKRRWRICLAVRASGTASLGGGRSTAFEHFRGHIWRATLPGCLGLASCSGLGCSSRPHGVLVSAVGAGWTQQCTRVLGRQGVGRVGQSKVLCVVILVLGSYGLSVRR
jgi:hypothetical protein